MQDFDEGYDNIRALSKDEDPAIFEYADVLSEFPKESSRGTVIIACSFIDVFIGEVD
ncbi:hypothetical protein AA103196_2171 [Ameyamaea chiangmaiensis NBRC 103196]|uniref:Uncharacterized protein n=1 Tax=Ameyamaea chiangmaiensis TaxID=442969 RepID=A0A850P6I8_9PROT|nr:hypothetical protein [Ameyamaea chiangmaiensis]MBS4075570.1 hypothetical protein [Ameyamaea chiangmaiensis]NVN40255.1 hypothetical protein [Ameyamaea chiangmaiensis]GBQ69294.1 hypothetical protein AA103196_2171 [Ameyamaea chiangmaiensis NBRC 103196]